MKYSHGNKPQSKMFECYAKYTGKFCFFFIINNVLGFH